MQLVIDIDDREYNEIKEDAEKFKSKGMVVPYLYKIILSGAPFPECYGKLIDADEVKKRYPLEVDGLDLRGNNQCIHTAMDEATAIIEARKEVKNDN